MAGEKWTVQCADGAGRAKAMTVRVTQDQVVLHLPAGESAVLAAVQAVLLVDVLGIAGDTLRLDGIGRGRPDPGAVQ